MEVKIIFTKFWRGKERKGTSLLAGTFIHIICYIDVLRPSPGSPKKSSLRAAEEEGFQGPLIPELVSLPRVWAENTPCWYLSCLCPPASRSQKTAFLLQAPGEEHPAPWPRPAGPALSQPRLPPPVAVSAPGMDQGLRWPLASVPTPPSLNTKVRTRPFPQPPAPHRQPQGNTNSMTQSLAICRE